MMALVGVSISGMPGPPLGPSYRITMTAPCKAQRRAFRTCSESAEHSACLLLAMTPVSLPPTSTGHRRLLEDRRHASLVAHGHQPEPELEPVSSSEYVSSASHAATHLQLLGVVIDDGDHVLLPVEDTRRAPELQTLFAGDLSNAALQGQVQDEQAGAPMLG